MKPINNPKHAPLSPAAYAFRRHGGDRAAPVGGYSDSAHRAERTFMGSVVPRAVKRGRRFKAFRRDHTCLESAGHGLWHPVYPGRVADVRGQRSHKSRWLSRRDARDRAQFSPPLYQYQQDMISKIAAGQPGRIDGQWIVYQPLASRVLTYDESMCTITVNDKHVRSGEVLPAAFNASARLQAEGRIARRPC